jgi:carboxylate-amine ligase
MVFSDSQLSYGIEEEFFLFDPATRDLVARPPARFMEDCRRRLGDGVAHEMHRCMVETASPVLHDAAQARQSVLDSRAALAAAAAANGLGLAAAGTHPLAAWNEQATTRGPRYDRLVDDFQIVGRRNLFCGLHVHVAIPEGVDRIRLMNRLMPWLPVLLALSTSSPFWNAQDTGLLSYRQAAYDEWPRSGIPDAFEDEAQYRSFTDLLARCGALEDASYLWWAIRPSSRFPTLELRICDACTRAEDALAVAAAFRCLVRAHLCRPALGAGASAITRRVIDENRWSAKRHGTGATFIDEIARAPVPFTEALAAMLRLVAPDAAALGCEAELRHLAGIPATGTSGHRQRAIFARHVAAGALPTEALQCVVDWLGRTTAGGAPVAGPAFPLGAIRQSLLGVVSA